MSYFVLLLWCHPAYVCEHRCRHQTSLGFGEQSFKVSSAANAKSHAWSPTIKMWLVQQIWAFRRCVSTTRGCEQGAGTLTKQGCRAVTVRRIHTDAVSDLQLKKLHGTVLSLGALLLSPGIVLMFWWANFLHQGQHCCLWVLFNPHPLHMYLSFCTLFEALFAHKWITNLWKLKNWLMVLWS